MCAGVVAATFVSANDVRALAQAIADLIDDPARRSEMGAKARRRVHDALSWPWSADALLDCYSSLLGTAAHREADRTGVSPRRPRPMT